MRLILARRSVRWARCRPPSPPPTSRSSRTPARRHRGRRRVAPLTPLQAIPRVDGTDLGAWLPIRRPRRWLRPAATADPATRPAADNFRPATPGPPYLRSVPCLRSRGHAMWAIELHTAVVRDGESFCQVAPERTGSVLLYLGSGRSGHISTTRKPRHKQTPSRGARLSLGRPRPTSMTALLRPFHSSEGQATSRWTGGPPWRCCSFRA